MVITSPLENNVLHHYYQLRSHHQNPRNLYTFDNDNSQLYSLEPSHPDYLYNTKTDQSDDCQYHIKSRLQVLYQKTNQVLFPELTDGDPYLKLERLAQCARHQWQIGRASCRDRTTVDEEEGAM